MDTFFLEMWKDAFQKVCAPAISNITENLEHSSEDEKVSKLTFALFYVVGASEKLFLAAFAPCSVVSPACTVSEKVCFLVLLFDKLTLVCR